MARQLLAVISKPGVVSDDPRLAEETEPLPIIVVTRRRRGVVAVALGRGLTAGPVVWSDEARAATWPFGLRLAGGL